MRSTHVTGTPCRCSRTEVPPRSTQRVPATHNIPPVPGIIFNPVRGLLTNKPKITQRLGNRLWTCACLSAEHTIHTRISYLRLSDYPLLLTKLHLVFISVPQIFRERRVGEEHHDIFPIVANGEDMKWSDAVCSRRTCPYEAN